MALHEDTGGIRPKLDEQSANTDAGCSTVARKAAAARAYCAALLMPDPVQQLHARFAALMDLARARGD